MRTHDRYDRTPTRFVGIVCACAIGLSACNAPTTAARPSDDADSHEPSITQQATAVARAVRNGVAEMFKATPSPQVHATPLTHSDERPAPRTVRKAESPHAVAPARTVAAPVVAVPPTASSDRDVAVGPLPPRDASVLVFENTPIYLLPDRSRTPLRTLPAHTSVKFLEADGGWYHVVFQDPQWGTRYGYIESRQVDVNSIAADLSVRGRTASQQPVDVSVPTRRPSPPERAVDLSIIKRPATGAAAPSNEPVDLSVRPHDSAPVDLSAPRVSSEEPVDLSIRPKNR